MLWLCLDVTAAVQCSRVALSACNVLSWACNHCSLSSGVHFALFGIDVHAAVNSLSCCLLARSLMFLKLLQLFDDAVADDVLDDAEIALCVYLLSLELLRAETKNVYTYILDWYRLCQS